MADDTYKSNEDLHAEIARLETELEHMRNGGNGIQSFLDGLLRKTLEASHHLEYMFHVDDECFSYLSGHADKIKFPLRRFSDTIGRLHPDDADRYTAAIAAARANGGMAVPYVIEYRYATPDSGYRWFREYGSKIEWRSGNRCLAGLAIDITDQKDREELLTRQECKYEELSRQFKAILDAVPDVVTLHTTDYRVIWTNRVGVETTGLTEDQVIGNICYEVRRKRTEPCDVCPVRNSIATGEPSVEETLTPSGLLLEQFAVPIKDDGGDVASVIELVRDVTTRRKLTESRLKMRKLESLGVLAGGIAHDFNNLLAGIQGNIGLAKLYLHPTHEAMEALTDAERVSERAKRLTNQFLTFSRGGVPVRKPVDIGSFVSRQVDLARKEIGLTVETDIPDALPACDVDTSQMEQVFHNLFTNAAEAMDRDGTVTVTVKSERISSDTTMPIAPGSYVMISIADTGSGIEEEHLENVFDPYFTTKQMGHGLGLAVVFSIIQKHHGHIEAISPSGGGAEFRFYLREGDRPVDADDADHCECEPMEATDTYGMSILFMDDDAVIRQTTGKLLENRGFFVDTVGDGDIAVERYTERFESGAPYDLVILDLMVQRGMGGKAALECIRKVNPDVRAVISSGYYNDPAMADFMAHGFLGKAEKPYRIDELMRIIRNVLSDP